MRTSDSAALRNSADIAAEAPPSRRWSPSRTGIVVVSVLAAVAGVAVVAATRVPEFYRQRLVVSDGDDAARRLMSDVSAFHASFIREGAWEASFSETDVNAWLALDLPRNHGRVLPDHLVEPRVRFTPRRVHGAVRIGRGGLSAVAVVVAEVLLREPNQLGICIEEASLGSLPLPRGMVLAEVRRRLDRIGMVTSIRRLDGRTVLVVYIPSTHESGGMSHWLDSLAIGEGAVAVSGHTRPGRPPLVAGSDGG